MVATIEPVAWPANPARPVLLPAAPEATLLQWLLQLPARATRLLLHQLQGLLSVPNRALGMPFLVGNFAPTFTEMFARELPLVTAPADGASAAPRLAGAAELPAGLSGALLRIGPNPRLAPTGGYHWFDGDGMVHAVRIKDGAASYCNRWVPTSRLAQEAAAGTPLFLKLGDYVGWRALLLLALGKLRTLLRLTDRSAGTGTANTAMVCHAARLLALNEGDLPHALRLACDGLLEAVGRLTVSAPAGPSFTAHPKLDPLTGELLFFRYGFDSPPFAAFGVLGPKGDLTKTIDISTANLPRPIMMHDFAITASYTVWMDHPLVFDGERMVKGNKLPLVFKPEQGSRIGLLRRDAADDAGMVWIDVPTHMTFHTANAWEEPDGTVKLFACATETISLNLDTRTAGAIPPSECPRLALVSVHPDRPKAGTLRYVTATCGDFPTLNPAYVGRRSRYAYVACMVTGFGSAVKWDGVAKLDLQAADAGAQEAVVGRIQLPAGMYNGETVFVPRHEDPEQCDGEDDGWLLTYVHDETAAAESGSSVVVWDAATMASEPVAVIALPQRVPYGFHALFVTESQVRAHAAAHPR